jgi:hypothetical protein
VEGIADIHHCEIFRLHGIPTKIVSGRGPQFAVHVMKALYEWLGIMHTLTTAYHPQSNGQMEGANQEVERHLCLFTNACQDDWVKYLPMAEFVLNSHHHSAHQMAPFEVMYSMGTVQILLFLWDPQLNSQPSTPDFNTFKNHIKKPKLHYRIKNGQ